MVNITPLQRLWLESRGGRTINDVMEINGTLFVAMRSQKQWVSVIIPSDRTINIFNRVVFNKQRQGKVLVARYNNDVDKYIQENSTN